MKMQHLIGALIAFSLACCGKKDDNRQYSYWHVGTDSFSTNDVRAEKGTVIAEITGNNLKNYFALQFNLNDYPTTGTFNMDCVQQKADAVCFSLTYNSIAYVPKNGFVTANSRNGKGRYILNPTWFYKEPLQTDSVLVHGIFNEP